MYTLIVQLCMVFFTVQSLNVPFCINCKHFIPDKLGGKYGKCKMAPVDITEYLVTGNVKDIAFHYCTTSRAHDNMCGKNGTKYDYM